MNTIMRMALLFSCFLAVPRASWAEPDMSQLSNDIKIYFKYLRGTASQEERETAVKNSKKDIKKFAVIAAITMVTGFGVLATVALIDSLRDESHAKLSIKNKSIIEQDVEVLINSRTFKSGDVLQLINHENKGKVIRSTFVLHLKSLCGLSDEYLSNIAHLITPIVQADKNIQINLIVKSDKTKSESRYVLDNGTWNQVID